MPPETVSNSDSSNKKTDYIQTKINVTGTRRNMNNKNASWLKYKENMKDKKQGNLFYIS